MTHLLVGADHAGFALKEALVPVLKKLRVTVIDLTPRLQPDDDYPLIAHDLADRIGPAQNNLGLLICGSGHGMDIAANRRVGVRAVVIRSPAEAKLAREHNHANVLVLGAWQTSFKQATSIIKAFFHARPNQAARHLRRIKEMDAPFA